MIRSPELEARLHHGRHAFPARLTPVHARVIPRQVHRDAVVSTRRGDRGSLGSFVGDDDVEGHGRELLERRPQHRGQERGHARRRATRAHDPGSNHRTDQQVSIRSHQRRGGGRHCRRRTTTAAAGPGSSHPGPAAADAAATNTTATDSSTAASYWSHATARSNTRATSGPRRRGGRQDAVQRHVRGRRPPGETRRDERLRCGAFDHHECAVHRRKPGRSRLGLR